MDTNLPQRVLGAHRKGSIEDITKPIFPTTSELSLRPCRHSSLARPRHSLPDHHSPPRYPDRDHSPSPEDRARAERCRSPRMFDSTSLPRELPHQPSLSWNRGEHLPHSSPPTARCPAPRTFLFLLNPLAQERTTPTLSDLGLGPIHQTIPSNFSEMKILVWNCRGAGSTSFHRNFLDMTRRLRPAIAIIMETRISGTKAEEVSSSLSFNNVCRSDASSFSGGIWILWNAQDTDLDILSVTDQAIHAVVQTGLLKADHICTLGTGWRLGTGSLANLWVDNWSGRGPLRSMIHGPLSRNEELLKVPPQPQQPSPPPHSSHPSKSSPPLPRQHSLGPSHLSQEALLTTRSQLYHRGLPTCTCRHVQTSVVASQFLSHQLGVDPCVAHPCPSASSLRT
ncbi:hypothetical protein CFP56_000457 [Quercus suber]|uniref:Endonuclease/exonuclease/phosphatase domain-containing protein n=1 Tax=Quercus suber TaxID=58331 RepID=A0AAW0MB54_QUESU